MASFRINDSGNYVIEDYGELMSDFFAEYTIVFCQQKCLYYLYDDSTGIYIEWTEFLQKQTIKEYLDTIDVSMWTPRIEKQMLAAIPGHVASVQKMNPRKNILVLDDCVLNLRTFLQEPYDAKYYATWKLDVKYNPEAECPIYDSFIESVSCQDRDMVLTLNELMGYVLTNSIKAHKLFILVGEGSNGKSVYLDVLNELITEDNVSNISLAELNSKPFARHFISEKRVNIVYENETEMKLSQLFSGITKSIVTGDKINAEIKGGANYSFRANIKLVLATNKLPSIDSIPSVAVKRRYVIIPFKMFYDAKTADKNLFTKLKKEKAGILNRAIEGLKRLRRQGYVFSYQKKSDELFTSMIEEAFPIIGFVNTKIIQDAGGRVLYSELRKAYADYCDEHDIYSMCVGNNFPAQLKKVLQDRRIPIETRKANGERGLVGIRLKDE